MLRDLLLSHLNIKTSEQRRNLLIAESPLTQKADLVVQHLDRLARGHCLFFSPSRFAQFASSQSQLRCRVHSFFCHAMPPEASTTIGGTQPTQGWSSSAVISGAYTYAVNPNASLRNP